MQDELLRLEGVSKTIIFVTMILSEALRLGNRMAVMKEGSCPIGTPGEIVANPADDYVRFVQDERKPHLARRKSGASELKRDHLQSLKMSCLDWW